VIQITAAVRSPGRLAGCGVGHLCRATCTSMTDSSRVMASRTPMRYATIALLLAVLVPVDPVQSDPTHSSSCMPPACSMSKPDASSKPAGVLIQGDRIVEGQPDGGSILRGRRSSTWRSVLSEPFVCQIPCNREKYREIQAISARTVAIESSQNAIPEPSFSTSTSC
jgi:hypothetical protein